MDADRTKRLQVQLTTEELAAVDDSGSTIGSPRARRPSESY